MIKSYPKTKPYRNPKYLEFIRSKSDVLEGGPAEPHHIKDSRYGFGMKLKSHDYCTIPVSRDSHNRLESGNLKLPEEDLILRYLFCYCKKVGEARDLIYHLMEFAEMHR